MSGFGTITASVNKPVFNSFRKRELVALQQQLYDLNRAARRSGETNPESRPATTAGSCADCNGSLTPHERSGYLALTSRLAAMQPPALAIPSDSLIFGYGPMFPFAAAAAGTWLLPPPWAGVAVILAIIWGALILSFVAGVRRGYGFGSRTASTPAEIVSMLAYFIPAALALVLTSFGLPAIALLLLLVGFVLVIRPDGRAAHAGDAPAHFARLRGPQMSIGIISLAAILIRLDDLIGTSAGEHGRPSASRLPDQMAAGELDLWSELKQSDASSGEASGQLTFVINLSG